jgi:hypothetical protein
MMKLQHWPPGKPKVHQELLHQNRLLPNWSQQQDVNSGIQPSVNMGRSRSR